MTLLSSTMVLPVTEAEARTVVQVFLDKRKSSKTLMNLYRFNTGWLATFSAAAGEVGGGALAVYDNGQLQKMPSAPPPRLLEILNEEEQSPE